MLHIIASKKSYTKPEDNKTFLSVILGDGTSVPVEQEQYDSLKAGQTVMVISQKLKTKAGAFFTLRTVVPVTLQA